MIAKNKQPAPVLDKKADMWHQRFEYCNNRQSDLFDEARKHYDIMYAVFNTKNIAPWRSKVYVPVLASKAWDLIARESDIVPLFDVTIKNELEVDDEGKLQPKPGVSDREKLIQSKLHYDYLNCSGEPMKLKIFDTLIDSVVAGTGYGYAPWVLEDKTSYARPFDEESGRITDNTKVIKKTEKKGHNSFDPVNFFNVFIPQASSFWSAPYWIVRGFKSKVEMQKAGIYKNLDKTSSTVREDTFQINNAARNRIVNEQDQANKDDTVDMVTYYECYESTKDGLERTVYAEGDSEDNAWLEILPTSKPYWHNLPPIVPFYTRRKPFSPFGESLFENNRTLQSATNDLFNHYLDNWNISVDSMLMYEDGSLTNDFIIEPGGEITYTGEVPKQFKFPEPDPAQLTNVLNVLNQGIENATVPQYLSGVPNSSIDKTQGTATGVTKITEAATEKIGFYRDNYKQSMKMIGRLWLSNLQQFMDEPEEIRTTKNGQKSPAVVMPGDMQGEIELDVDDDSMTPVTKSDRRDVLTGFTTQIVGLQNQAIQQAQLFDTFEDIPRFNFVDMIGDIAYAYGVKDPDNYLKDNQQAAQQLEQKQAAAQQAGPPARPPIENISYKDAPPDIRAQMEQQAGMTPSAIHEHEAASLAAQHVTDMHSITNPSLQGGAQPVMPNGANVESGSTQATSPSA